MHVYAPRDSESKGLDWCARKAKSLAGVSIVNLFGTPVHMGKSAPMNENLANALVQLAVGILRVLPNDHAKRRKCIEHVIFPDSLGLSTSEEPREFLAALW